MVLVCSAALLGGSLQLAATVDSAFADEAAVQFAVDAVADPERLGALLPGVVRGAA